MLGTGEQIVAAHFLQANSHITNKQNKTGVEAIRHSSRQRILAPSPCLKCYVNASLLCSTRSRHEKKYSRLCVQRDCRRRGPVSSWQSRLQTSAAAQEAIWLNSLLEEMGFRITKKPIILQYENSKAAIIFSDHPGDHRRSSQSILTPENTFYVTQ